MKSKYKPLPRNTKFIVEFHDGIHSFYATKGSILKREAFHTPAMSQAVWLALMALETEREAMWGQSEVVNAIGTCKGHPFSLDIAAYRI